MHPAKLFTLLVATDFSPRAAYALDFSAALSKKKGYDIFLMHVFNPEVTNGSGPAEVAYGNARRKLEDTIDEYSSKYLIEIKGLLETGNIFSTINQTTSLVDADMLVLPIHQQVGIQNLVGRFAFRIIASSPVPVLVIQNPMKFISFDRVLLPIDFTQPFEENVKKAIEFASLHNSTIMVFSVTEADSFISSMILRRNMAFVKNRIEKCGLLCETHCVKKQLAPVHQHITDFARKSNADVILMMARREDDYDELFVGGTAGRVLSNSMVPVVVNAPMRNKQNNKLIPGLINKIVQKVKM